VSASHTVFTIKSASQSCPDFYQMCSYLLPVHVCSLRCAAAMKNSTKAAGGRQLGHKDMERKQPPMTSFFAPLIAVTYSSNPRSSKRPPSSLLGAKLIECKAPSKKRPLQILDKKADDLLIAKIATKVRGIGSHPPAIIAKSRAGTYSSDDDDSLCLAQLVAATKAKKENKAKKLKPEACRSETKKHINTKSRQIVSTESTVFLEQQLTSVQVPLPSLNDFGVLKAHSKTLSSFAKRTKNVKHLRKDRLAKGPPCTDTSVPLSLRDIGGPNLHADFSKRSTTRETELVTKQLLAVDPGTKIKELTIESLDESNDNLIASTAPPPNEALIDVDCEKKCEDAARLKKDFFVNSNNIAHALLDRSIYGPFAKLRPSAVTIDSNAITDGTETTDDKDTTDNNKKTASTCYATNQEKLSRTRIPWSIPSWLRLVQHNAGDSGKVTSMAWDRWGVLLAVAYESSAVSSGNPVVAIYDWDVLVAAYRRGRNQQLRWLHKGSTYGRDGAIEVERVEPFMTIPIPSRSRAPVTVLEWNPFRPDELVVGLR
jgi:hypothetical protein